MTIINLLGNGRPTRCGYNNNEICPELRYASASEQTGKGTFMMTSANLSAAKKRPLQGGTEADRAWQVLLVEDDQDDALLASRVLEQAERIGDVRNFKDAAHLFHYLTHHHLADGDIPTSS